MIVTVNQLRKDGKLSLAYEKATQQLNDNKNYKPYQEDMLWVYYAYLKKSVELKNIDHTSRIIEKLCELNVIDNQMFNESFNWQLVKIVNQKNLQNDEQRKLMRVIKKCGNLIVKQEASESKSILIKVMLRQFKNQEGFWTIFNFIDQKQYLVSDFGASEYKGRRIMAIYEQALYGFLKSWLQDANKMIPEAIAMAERVVFMLDAIEKPYKYKFLKYYQAKVYLIAQNKESALDMAKDFLRTSINQSYSWALLADCTDNMTQKIAYLSKALNLQRDKKYTVGVLHTLMNLFVKQQELDMAAVMAEKIIKIRQDQAWPIKSDIYKIEQGRIGILNSEEVEIRLNKASKKALSYCFENASKTIAIITGFNPNTSIYYLQDCSANTYKTRMKKGVKPGQFVSLIIDKKVLEATLIEKPSNITGAIKYFQGDFKAVKEFGFIQNVFIAPNLAKLLINGETKQGIAIKEINRKTKKEAWRAVSFN